MSFTHRYLTLIILSLLTSFASASDGKPAPSSEIQLKQSNTAAYMGVKVDLLPESLQAQLPEDVLVGQGILVTGFADDSPASKQGLEVHDVLLAYDRHALMHPKKFIDLIRNDKPGREVKLELARKGEIITVPVKLTSQQYPLDEDQLDYQYNMQVMGFDGLKIKQYSADDFEAAIRYLAPDGVVRSRTFTGTYRKIQYEVMSAPDISKIAKQHLMQAVTERKENEDGWLGKWMPFNDGNFSKDSIRNFGL